MSHIPPVRKRRKIRSCHDTTGGCGARPAQKSQRRVEGLGDKVERIAQPIAKVIDKAFGTNLRRCGGCQKRKEWLNRHSRK